MPIRDRLRRLLKPKSPQKSPSFAPPEPPEMSTVSPDASARPARELVLYKYDACPYCRRVMRVVDDLGLADRIEYRDTRTEPKWRQDLISRTGTTQVPCLFIDGVAMFESADISDWLQSNYA